MLTFRCIFCWFLAMCQLNHWFHVLLELNCPNCDCFDDQNLSKWSNAFLWLTDFHLDSMSLSMIIVSFSLPLELFFPNCTLQLVSFDRIFLPIFIFQRGIRTFSADATKLIKEQRSFTLPLWNLKEKNCWPYDRLCDPKN